MFQYLELLFLFDLQIVDQSLEEVLFVVFVVITVVVVVTVVALVALIDVVFVAEDGYVGDTAQFRTDVTDLILSWYYTLDTKLTRYTIPADYRDMFNFYIYTGGFGTDAGCSGTLPAGFWDDVPNCDTAGILRNTSGGGGCANTLGPPSKFQAPGRHGGVVLHESGHAIFGLIDEYCGDTWYPDEVADLPVMTNVWMTEAACLAQEAAEGWATGVCREISGEGGICPDGVWHYDGDWCIMDSADTDFDLACSRRISYVFDHWPTSSSDGVKLSLHIDANDVITLQGARLVDGHPDLGMQLGPFTGEIKSADGQIIHTFHIWDPRIELGDTKQVAAEADFEVVR